LIKGISQGSTATQIRALPPTNKTSPPIHCTVRMVRKTKKDPHCRKIATDNTGEQTNT